MLTEEKIKSVKKDLKSGVPEGEIKNQLLKEGYTSEEVEKIFTPHQYDMRSWYLFFALLFLALGIYFALVTESFKFLFFSGAMFFVYYVEIERHKKSAS